MTQNLLISAARFVAGRPAKRTSGLATAVICGTHSTPEVSAQRAFSSGLKRSAFLAFDGRRTRSGMRSDLGKRLTKLPASSSFDSPTVRDSRREHFCSDVQPSRAGS